MARIPKADITVDNGATTFGMMLDRDKKGVLLYKDARSAVLDPNISPDSVKYAAFKPDEDWPIAQESWHDSFGKVLSDPEHDIRASTSDGWDLRNENQAKFFSAEAAVTVTLKDALTTASFSNMDFEGTTAWTKSAVTGLHRWDAARSSASAKAGTYSWLLEAYKGDDFTADNWTDVGTEVAVDTVDARMEFDAYRDADDQRCHVDLTAISDSVWACDFDIRITGGQAATATPTMYLGAYSALEDPNGMAGDAIQMRFYYSSAAGGTWDTVLVSINGGAADASVGGPSGMALNTTYYARLERTSTIEMKLSIFTDAARTTHFASSPVTLAISADVASLRYFQVSNFNDNAAAADHTAGWIDNWTFKGCAVQSNRITQPLSPWATYHLNKSGTFTCYGKTALANNLRIGLSFDGGSTITWQTDYCATTNDWTDQMTVTATPPTAGTGIMLVIERASTTYSGSDYVDVATFTQTAASRGTPAKNALLSWGSSRYYLENKTLFKYATNAYVELFNFEDAIVDAIIYKSRMLVTVGTGDFYYYSDSNDDDVWTRAAGASQKIGYLAAIGGTLYGTVASAALASTTDITGAWTTRSTIGDSSITITNLVEYDGTLYALKEDNVYVMTIASDATYTVEPVAPRFNSISSTDNFKQAAVAETLLLGHTKGLHSWEYTTYGELLDISPIKYAPTQTDFHGGVKAIAVDSDWTYIITDPTGSNNYSKILALRRSYIAKAENPVDWRWQPLGEVSLDEVYDADVHDGALWIAGTRSGTAAVKSFSLANTNFPSDGLGILVQFRVDSDTAWTTLPGGAFTAAADRAFQSGITFKRIQFRLLAAGTATLSLGTGIATPTALTNGANTITVTQAGNFTLSVPAGVIAVAESGTCTVSGSPQALIAGSTNTVTITGTGTFTITVGRPFETVYIDGGLPGEIKWASTLTLAGDTLNASTATTTPVIKSLILRCVLMTVPQREVTVTVRCEDDLIENIPGSTLKTNIDNLATATSPITLYDIRGNSMTCKMKAPTPWEHDVEVTRQDNEDIKVVSKIDLVFQQVRTT